MTVSLTMMNLNVDARPRQMVFSQIEKLIHFMNLPNGGIELKDKKSFLTTVHKSFNGTELIAWLSERICDKDSVEALQLATFLCMYGYIYPVDLKTFVVKDDKSVLYRFQCPYYWPSKNLKLTNEKYIIYLLKRSQRNKQKHGLEEHEQSALNKLQMVFSDKMGFVRSQAEEQVKQVKGMKRDDKLVHDLQERAFWRVHRPPPNQVKYLEDGPSRCFPPSQMATRRKKNRELKIKQVEYLRRAVTRPRMKFSKSLDIFFQRNDQYMEYDPFLDTLAVQPSNPWATEDDTMWEINRPLVEIPTVMRIKKWALSFEDLLQDETGWNEFEHFLKKEYSQENIHFYKTCKELIVSPLSRLAALKATIEREFLTPGAACEVNVDCKTMEVVTQQLKSQNENNNRYIFQPAMEHIYALMKKDSYTRFLRSDQYKALLQSAQAHYTKKRFFNFGSNRKKTPSPQPKRRGSTSSDNPPADGVSVASHGDIGGHSYHSYSTGNLRELDEKPKRTLSRQSHQSPSVRRRTEDVDKLAKEGRRRSNLDVPRVTVSTTPVDPTRKSESLAPCLAINVPRTNIVAPWEGNQS